MRHKIEMDFGTLPVWTIKELQEMFSETREGSSRLFDFGRWKSKFEIYLSDLPEHDQIPFLIKAIEYTEKFIVEHKKDCRTKDCPKEQIWLRKIGQAKQELGKINPMELTASPVILPKFKFSGTKIDLIRVLNALYELRMIKGVDGLIPNKVVFMKEAGAFFQTDLADYDSSLSQAFKEGSIEPNLKIFEDMAEKTKNIILNKLG